MWRWHPNRIDHHIGLRPSKGRGTIVNEVALGFSVARGAAWGAGARGRVTTTAAR
jgi:hypothetical protein